MLRTLLLCTLALWLPASGALAGVVRLVATEYPPYYGASLPEQGLLVALTKAAFRQVGHDVTIEFQPWARALAEAEKGDHDGLIGIWRASEREKLIAYSAEALAENEIGFVGLKGRAISYASLDNLKPHTIGSVRGYSMPAVITQAGLTIELANDDLSNLKKLLAGRIDLALIDRGQADHLIAGQFSESRNLFAWIEPAVSRLPMFNGFSRARPGYERTVADFDRGFEKLRNSGELAAIRQKFGFR
ncbi:substrate-binding periplasmic protein [Azospirillum griseum]|nr:transporter substrate-binding domain-containing protein [Azospirillum griseum]